jgi:SAM-dependent methyltransferase
MQSPWLKIPLGDYEAHMASAPIAQAQMLAAQFEFFLKGCAPKSVAIFGCAGGNGLERINAKLTQRVVAIDINADYIEKTRDRFESCFLKFETLAVDVQNPALDFEPVDLILAGLIFEYVDVNAVIKNARRLLAPNGTLVTISQLPCDGSVNVSPSPYPSLQSLEPHLRIISPEALRAVAEHNGLSAMTSQQISLASGKAFQVQRFGKACEIV